MFSFACSLVWVCNRVIVSFLSKDFRGRGLSCLFFGQLRNVLWFALLFESLVTTPVGFKIPPVTSGSVTQCVSSFIGNAGFVPCDGARVLLLFYQCFCG